MNLRDIPELSLADLEKKMREDNDSEVTRVVTNSDIRARLTEGDPHLVLGDASVPVTGTGLTALGNWLDIPTPFLHRIDPDLQQTVLNGLLDRSGTAEAAVVHNDGGIVDVMSPGARRIRPLDIVNVASQATDPSMQVIEQVSTPGVFYRLDVAAPVDFDTHIGGDRKVGDITRGGIRIGVDIKHKLVPWVSSYMFRLVCTNGMECEKPSLKIDGRGLTLDEMLEHLEEKAQLAFAAVEREIDDFYKLRNEKVDNRERALRAIADDFDLPDRTLITMLHAARSEDYPADPDFSEFDLVNIVTNLANDPNIMHKGEARRRLEMVGGSIVTEHASRCANCNRTLLSI